MPGVCWDTLVHLQSWTARDNNISFWFGHCNVHVARQVGHLVFCEGPTIFSDTPTEQIERYLIHSISRVEGTNNTNNNIRSVVSKASSRWVVQRMLCLLDIRQLVLEAVFNQTVCLPIILVVRDILSGD